MDIVEIPIHNFQRHPWEIARLNFFKKVLKYFCNLQKYKKILDVGSGDAWFAKNILQEFQDDSKIFCWDHNYISFHSSDSKIVFIKSIPYETFEIALLLDVLEHVEKDFNFLNKILNILDDNAKLLISVPAWNKLFSKHDRKLKHYRRYNPNHIRQLLLNSKLEIIVSGGLFHGPLIIRFITFLMEKIKTQNHSESYSLEWKWSPNLANLTSAILYFDTSISFFAARHGFTLPGLSWWALCKKL